MAIAKRKTNWKTKAKKAVATAAAVSLIGTGIHAQSRIAAEKRAWMAEYVKTRSPQISYVERSDFRSTYYFLRDPKVFGERALLLNDKSISSLSNLNKDTKISTSEILRLMETHPLGSPSLNGMQNERLVNINLRMKRGKIRKSTGQNLKTLIRTTHSYNPQLQEIQQIIDKEAIKSGRLAYMDLERPDIDWLKTDKSFEKAKKKGTPHNWEVFYKGKITEKDILGNK